MTINFKAARVLVLGDVMLDSYYVGSTQRISPEAPVPVVNIHSIEKRPGGAANVALNIAALGGDVRLISVTGSDENSADLESGLHVAGVTTDFLKLDHFQTIVKQRILSQNQQLLRLDFERPLQLSSQEPILQKFQHHLDWANMVVLSDYAKGVLRPDVALFIDAARAKNIPVLVDPKCHDLSFYRGATLLTPNFKEFQAAVGDVLNESDLIEKGQQCLLDGDFSAILVTRGAEGMTLLEKDCPEYYLPARGREVFDVTGAGDTVIATIAVALAVNYSLTTAVEFGNAAAGIVIGKVGTATLSAQELQQAIHGDSDHHSGVVDEETLMIRLQEARARGKKIVFTNGCFDVLHAMHVEYLTLARQQGDCLIVAVNDDASITRLKGPGRPVNKAEHRMAVLAGLQAVDWVIPMNDDTPNRLLEALRPDVLAKGGDYRLEGVVGADIVTAYGGKVVVLGGVADGVKSTAIIERLKKLQG